MSEAKEEPGKRRAIRSFVLRSGRMTDGQARALEELWPRYGIEPVGGPIDLPMLFGRSAPVTLEIGFGNGDNLLALAIAHPEWDFIGVEVHPPGVGRLLHAAAAAGLTNLRVIQHDAVEVLRERIAPAALQSILVLFPDPWHKKRHHKRRLINGEFAALAASRLVQEGTLQLATDWVPYAEWMREVLDASPLLSNRAGGSGYVPRNPGRVRTRFEARGERLGHEVRDLCYARISPSSAGPEPDARRCTP
ncbi:MAG: tRNA (guanosine(46)-N7)-methyltransferase TrmB [Pseudomonadota bacterium]|nr:tRNA (guanosine(46)-N7)-methyltransferase TrmB [Pseudomonadota bacterium]